MNRNIYEFTYILIKHLMNVKYPMDPLGDDANMTESEFWQQ